MLLYFVKLCARTTSYLLLSIYFTIYNFIVRPLAIIFNSLRDLAYLPVNVILYTFWNTTLQKILYDFTNLSVDRHLLLTIVQFFIALVVLGIGIGMLTGLVLGKLYHIIQGTQFIVEINLNFNITHYFIAWTKPVVNLLQVCESFIHSLWNLITKLNTNRDNDTPEEREKYYSANDTNVSDQSYNSVSLNLVDPSSTSHKDNFYNVINELPSNFFQDSDNLDSTIQDNVLTPPLSPLQKVVSPNLDSSTKIMNTNTKYNSRNRNSTRKTKQRKLSIHSIGREDNNRSNSATIWDHYNNDAEYVRQPVDKNSLKLKNLKRSLSK